MKTATRFLLSVLVFSALASAQSGRDQLLKLRFQAGVSHMNGRYGFTQDNFLVEGGKRLDEFGSTAIFLKLLPDYKGTYPDKGNPPFWPSTAPTSLTQLIQTDPYKAVLNMPFNMIVITAYTFANSDYVENFAIDPTAAASEEKEFYDLTRYLLSAYAGTGKTFILKHWEGDYVGLQGHDTSKDISPYMVDAMRIWLTARQRGVSRARQDAGNPAGVGVFHAVEVARVLDYSQRGLTRVVNAVIPAVKPDIVSYSSYDSSLQGSDATSAAASIAGALNTIKSFTSDPLGLGNKRVFISEYGLFENERSWAEQQWRTEAILNASQAAGLGGSFFWEIFDNECKDCSANYFPVDTDTFSASRPDVGQCRGLWLVRPDGSIGPVVPILSKYWFAPTSGVRVSGRVTRASDGSGIAGARVQFYGGAVAADSSGYYTLPTVPTGPVQITASASGFQNAWRTVSVGSSSISGQNLSLVASTAAGAISGHVVSAGSGAAISGATVSYSGGSALSDSSGYFKLSGVSGGRYSVTVKKSGYVSPTVSLLVQPGITSALNARIATGGRLTGRLQNYAGAPISGANVNLHGGNVNSSKTVTTDATGFFDSGWLPTGAYRVNITGAGFASIVATANLTAGVIATRNFVTGVPDFVLNAAPALQITAVPLTAAFSVHLARSGGSTQAVSFSVRGLPSNTSAAFTSTSRPDQTQLRITTTLSTPPGIYTLTITGTSGSTSHSVQAVLNLTPPPAPGVVVGTVRDGATGNPVAGAIVTSSCASTWTDSSGNYKLPSAANLTVHVEVKASGYQTAAAGAYISPGETQPLNFTLTPQ